MRIVIKCFLLLILYNACAACTGQKIDKALPARSEALSITIYLISHGWHAGIIISRTDIPNNVWPEHQEFLDAEYLEVGWGDSDYYQTPDPHLGITLKAALVPTASVLHIVGFDGSVTDYFSYSEIIEIKLTARGLEQLCRYIATSYFKDPAGNIVSLGAGLYGNSRFYQSHETYHLLNNCNKWTGRALLTAGCPIEVASILTVENLMRRARACGKVIQQKRDKQG